MRRMFLLISHVFTFAVGGAVGTYFHGCQNRPESKVQSFDIRKQRPPLGIPTAAEIKERIRDAAEKEKVEDIESTVGYRAAYTSLDSENLDWHHFFHFIGFSAGGQWESGWEPDKTVGVVVWVLDTPNNEVVGFRWTAEMRPIIFSGFVLGR